MARKSTDQEDHDEMVRDWVKALKEQGYSVKADLPEFTNRPSPVHGKVPDIEAIKEGRTIIGEQETCESIAWEHTRDQFVAFTKGRTQTRQFHASAPAACLEDLKAQVRQWRLEGYDITVDNYWQYYD